MKAKQTWLLKKLPEVYEVILLYIPLVLLVFPQQSGYWQVQVIFWCLPLFFLGLILQSPRRTVSTHHRWLALTLAGFLISSFISTFFSSARAYSLMRLADYLAVFIYGYYFYLVIDTSKKEKVFMYLNVAMALFLIMLSFLASSGLLMKNVRGVNLFTPTAGHNNIVDFLILVTPFLFAQVIKTGKIWKYILGLVCIQFLLAFSRAAHIGMLLIIAAYVASNQFRFSLHLKKLVGVLVVAVATLLCFQIVAPLVINVSSDQTPNPFVRQIIKPLTPRFAYWHQSLQAWQDNPQFGYGLGTFSLISGVYRSRPEQFSFFAHSWFFSILAEQGLVGLSLTLLGLVGLGFYMYQWWRKKSGTKAIYLPVAILSFVVVHLFDYGWLFLLPLLIWLVMVTLFLDQKFDRKLVLSRYQLSILFIPVSLFLTGYAGVYSFYQLSDQNCSHRYSIFPQCRLIRSAPITPSDLNRIYFWHQNDQSTWVNIIKQDTLELSFEEIRRVTLLNPFSSQVSFLVNYNHNQVTQLQKIIMLLDLLAMRHPAYYNVNLNRQEKNFIPDLQLGLVEIETNPAIDNLIQVYRANLDQEPLFYARLLYLLAIENYQVGHVTLTEKSLILATRLAPDWSPFFIELANIYSEQNKKELAEKTLQACQESHFAFEDCNFYQHTQEIRYFGNQYSSIIKENRL